MNKPVGYLLLSLAVIVCVRAAFADTIVSAKASPAVKIQKYEAYVRKTPGYAGFSVHNQLRMLYARQNPQRAMQECETILTHEPMKDYILSVLSGGTLSKPHVAIKKLQQVAGANPSCHAVQAACYIECGQLAWSLAQTKEAVNFYDQALQLTRSDESLVAYKQMAEFALKQAGGKTD